MPGIKNNTKGKRKKVITLRKKVITLRKKLFKNNNSKNNNSKNNRKVKIKVITLRKKLFKNNKSKNNKSKNNRKVKINSSSSSSSSSSSRSSSSSSNSSNNSLFNKSSSLNSNSSSNNSSLDGLTNLLSSFTIGNNNETMNENNFSIYNDTNNIFTPILSVYPLRQEQQLFNDNDLTNIFTRCKTRFNINENESKVKRFLNAYIYLETLSDHDKKEIDKSSNKINEIASRIKIAFSPLTTQEANVINQQFSGFAVSEKDDNNKDGIAKDEFTTDIIELFEKYIRFVIFHSSMETAIIASLYNNIDSYFLISLDFYFNRELPPTEFSNLAFHKDSLQDNQVFYVNLTYDNSEEMTGPEVIPITSEMSKKGSHNTTLIRYRIPRQGSFGFNNNLCIHASPLKNKSPIRIGENNTLTCSEDLNKYGINFCNVKTTSLPRLDVSTGKRNFIRSWFQYEENNLPRENFINGNGNHLFIQDYYLYNTNNRNNRINIHSSKNDDTSIVKNFIDYANKTFTSGNIYRGGLLKNKKNNTKKTKKQKSKKLKYIIGNKI
jgi:hypothetical protein